ncbi:hypothetical protein GGR55DRAFT_262094 [Xylaria sp. FL0064]|nr:hypothetical protein GGR55DRAFT_262094 [Xylaria sp. FL0064]
MRFLTIIPILLLPLLSAASPIQTTTSVASAAEDEAWIVDHASRKSSNENTICHWKFQVKQTFISSGTTTEPLQCDFINHVSEGQDCRITQFGPLVCSKSNDFFGVSAGHNGDGFMVMVIVNVQTNGRAYFAFTDEALDSGDDIPPQTSAVQYPEDRTSLPARQEDNDDSEQQVWKIEKLFRRVINDDKSMTMSFAIYGINDDDHDDNNPAVSCTLYLQAPEDVDIAKWQFYDQKCHESGFYVSWGYLESSDAGIMTLVNPARDHQAWFGFPDINKSEMLVPSLGGGIVHPCDCGGQHD